MAGGGSAGRRACTAAGRPQQRPRKTALREMAEKAQAEVERLAEEDPKASRRLEEAARQAEQAGNGGRRQ